MEPRSPQVSSGADKAAVGDEVTPEQPRLRRIALPGLPEQTYILESRPVERLLFGRELVGQEFARECLLASLDFCRLLAPRLDTRDVAELLILNGGRYYGLASAYSQVFGRPLPVNEVKATRRCTADGTWAADISYRHYVHAAGTLLIGDTVATGVSARVALEDFFTFHLPREVVFFTICGGIPGGRVIAETCARHGVALTLVFGVAAFGLAENGTDLPFLHPETVTDPRYLERARVVYGGKPVCAIGDWGERGEDPATYLATWAETKRAWGLA